jgi:hypothetical protein
MTEPDPPEYEPDDTEAQRIAEQYAEAGINYDREANDDPHP